VLQEQSWIHDSGLTVGKALQQGSLELVDYAWFSVN
jgi:translation elongation factor EF-Ts